jgi:hypothetical protein
MKNKATGYRQQTTGQEYRLLVPLPGEPAPTESKILTD